jgi:hypothetical protein
LLPSLGLVSADQKRFLQKIAKEAKISSGSRENPFVNFVSFC